MELPLVRSLGRSFAVRCRRVGVVGADAYGGDNVVSTLISRSASSMSSACRTHRRCLPTVLLSSRDSSGMLSFRVAGIPLRARAAAMSSSSSSANPGLKSSGVSSPEMDALLEEYALRKATPISLKYMLDLSQNKARRLATAQLLQHELLVRLAHRVRDLELRLPTGLANTRPVRRVARMYRSSFEDIALLPSPKSVSEDAAFVRTIKRLKTRDSQTLPTLAHGIKEWLAFSMMHTPEGFEPWWDPKLPALLDQFFTARLSIRMLIGQHVESLKTPGGRISKVSVKEVAEDAGERATALCERHFGEAPEIILEGDIDLEFIYVRSHLHHMIFEMIKNSMRAIVESHQGEAGEERRKRLVLSSSSSPLNPQSMPPVRVIIAGNETSEDVVIKISDEGGGIPRSSLPRLFSYQYTTATGLLGQGGSHEEPAELLPGEHPQSYNTFRENFFGMGYGLPISRVFARYFGGDVSIFFLFS